jgi:hypothetical protein
MMSAKNREAMQRDWLASIEGEIERRKVDRESEVELESDKLLTELCEMGERLLAGGGEFFALLEELVAADGKLERVDEIRFREDMSVMEAVSLVLMKEPETAMRLLNEYAARVMD